MTFKNPIDQLNEFHFMVDLETLALSIDAAVTEIGAVAMSPCKDTKFHIHCFDRSGKQDPNTLKWRNEHNLPWKKKDEVQDLFDVLKEFEYWIIRNAVGRTPILWCKGTDFDSAILTYKFKWYQMNPPWKYNSVRDMRTLLSLFPEYQIPKEDVKHDGLEDAALQVGQVLRIFDQLELLNEHSELDE